MLDISRTISPHHLSNSDSMIIQNYFLNCFNVFNGCWCARATRTIIVIDIFSAFLKSVIPQLNLCCAHSRLVKHHSQHLKCLCTFNFIFFTQILIQFLLDPFIRMLKTRRGHQNSTHIFICQKQIGNPKWLIKSNYVYNRKKK